MKGYWTVAAAGLVLGLAPFSGAWSGPAPLALPALIAEGSGPTGLDPAAARTAADDWNLDGRPIRIALQAGHWKAAEAPDEQAGLRTNGTRGGGKAEWEVNLAIAQATARQLRDEGYEVEVLPTTIPPGYRADLFVAVHADGSPSSSISGFRAAAPRRDRTGQAQQFVTTLEQIYGTVTGLPHYPVVTRRMENYYAFNSRRYEHALDPNTVAAIIETGFLTSPSDRRVLIGSPDRAAEGIARGIRVFVETSRLQPRAVALFRTSSVGSITLPRISAD